MSGDDGGLLGNLPRTRPGTRSEKRPSPDSAARESPAAAEPEADPGDPVADALRSAGRVAEAGARIAQDVAKELIRRLPRP